MSPRATTAAPTTKPPTTKVGATQAPATKAAATKAPAKKTTAKKAVPKKAAAVRGAGTAAATGTAGTALPRPALGTAPRISVPRTAERLLANGLRVVAVRREAVPMVEVRLRMPFAGTTAAFAAQSSLLTETFFSGTERHDALSLAEAIQALGGGLSAGADSDRLALGGSALAGELRGLLGLIAEVLTANTYPADEVAGERDRQVEELTIARTVPGTVAAEALARRTFGDHPYGLGMPSAEQVQAVTASSLRRMHATRVSPAGALLVLVGDIAPARALDQVEKALGGWSPDGRRQVSLPAVPALVPGDISLVDRPGLVQSCLRMVAPGPRRSDADHPALVAAMTVFAGYFSSRLVANIREDKGYTYSPHAGLEHLGLASILTVAADVATEVTAPALVETNYEMAKVAALPVTQDELDSARRYLIGSLALSTSSQAGLATSLIRLLDVGLSASYLRDYPAALEAVTVESAYEAAQRWLAPAATATVIVGDAAEVAGPLAALDTVVSYRVD